MLLLYIKQWVPFQLPFQGNSMATLSWKSALSSDHEENETMIS